MKLMLLEDRAEDREAVERIVHPLADVEWMGVYTEPRKALEEAAKRKPDVVIVAVELAEMNGLTFTSKLQELLPSVRVIVSALSGNYARQAYDAGASGYLLKPVSKESLMKVLRQSSTKIHFGIERR